MIVGALGWALTGCGGGGGSGGGGSGSTPATNNGGDGSSTPQTYLISASVSGLTGSGLVMVQGNGATTAVSTNGQITVATGVATGAVYSVDIDTQPVNPVQTCTVASGSGTVASANVVVSVSCVAGTATTVNAAKTTVVIDSSVPAAVASIINTISSPIDSQPKGSALFVPVSFNAGESMVFASDADHNVLLAALSSSTTTITLNANSTALALTRLSIGALPETITASQVNATIQATAGYPALVASVSAALAANSSPAVSNTVFANIGIVTSQLPNSVLAALAQPQRVTRHTQGTPVADPNITVTPSPFVLISTHAGGTVLGTVSVTMATTDGGVQASNTTAIAWSLASSDTAGERLCPTGVSTSTANPDCSVLIPHTGLVASLLNVAPSTGNIPGDGEAFNITLEQNTVSRTANTLQIGKDLLQVGLSLYTAGASAPAVSCISNLLNVLLPPDEVATLALNPSGPALLAYLQKIFGAKSIISTAKTISGCTIVKLPVGSNPVDLSFQQSLLNFVDGFANYIYNGFGRITGGLLTVGATAGGIPLELSETMTSWAVVRVFGVCEGGSPFKITNCATSFQFDPANKTLAPGEKFTPVPTAYDVNPKMTLMPGDIEYSTKDTGVVSLDETTGLITALALPAGTLSATATITLTDTATGVSGSFTVTVAALPTVTLTATPMSVDLNGNSTISWTSTNATSCLAKEGWSASTATSGSLSTGPLTQTTTYTMTCGDENGRVSTASAVTITVNPTVPILTVYKFLTPSPDGIDIHTPPPGVDILTPIPIVITGSTTNSSCTNDIFGHSSCSGPTTTAINDAPGGPKGASAGISGTVIGAGGLYDPRICSVGTKWIARPAYTWQVIENDGLAPGYTGAGYIRQRGGTVSLDSSGQLTITYQQHDTDDRTIADATSSQTTKIDQLFNSTYINNLNTGEGNYKESTTNQSRFDSALFIAGVAPSWSQGETTDSGSGTWPSGTPLTDVYLQVVRTVPSTDPVPAECTTP
jgi:hypothetical protein